MNFKPILFLIVSFSFLTVELPKNIQKKVDEEIRDAFKIEMFQFNSKLISENVAKTLPSNFGKDNFFEIKNSETLLGYAYISKAPSKTDQFDYLILLDNNLVILKAKVLVYREDYGSEIGSPRWLKQFIGKTEQDQLKYKDNIAAISGATISVRSMTNAVNNLLQSLRILHSKHIL
ncbi:FMN-binding protein [Flavobacteriaceae bacterium LMO-SS05]|jgi:Na+-translocating ferredoxin:NAD+ oxidoreductase RnfG subunit